MINSAFELVPSMVAKLVVLIVVLCIGVAGYACVEIYQRGREREEEVGDQPDTVSAHSQ